MSNESENHDTGISGNVILMRRGEHGNVINLLFFICDPQGRIRNWR